MGYVTGTHDVDMTSRAKAASAASSSSSSSGSSSQRLLPKRWRSKGKNSSSSSSGSSQQAMWTPEDPCSWCCVSGRRVVLKPISILHLSEAERLALQKLASSRLQTMELGCPIVIPKDNIGEWGRQRKRALSLKRKCKSANLGSLLDTLASDKGKDKDNKGLAFGIALSRVILNDRQRITRRESTAVSITTTSTPSTTPSSSTTPTRGHRRTGSADLLLSPSHDRKSSSSSQGSLENGAPNGSAGGTAGNLSESSKRVASSDSLSTWDESNESAGGYSLIEALSLSAPGVDAGQSQLLGDGPQVPHVVSTCFHHLETYGLNVVGIFRVGSSKKRVKQLREEFDSGQPLELTEEHNVHDVGALLKEFFRDLPEPLLTRDLFLPFVATRKIKDRTKQLEAMRLLLTLLPVANRDTLWALLRFLLTVHQHCEDRVDGNGQEVPGNKMDSQNLATLFGPNVLHCLRPALSEKQMLAECAEQAEQSSEVIGVTKDLINHHVQLFEVSGSQHDEVLKLMMEADRENLEAALRRLSSEQADADLDSIIGSSTIGTPAAAAETPSLAETHHCSSDADLLSLVQRRRQESGVDQHQPLRACRSADPWTDDDGGGGGITPNPPRSVPADGLLRVPAGGSEDTASEGKSPTTPRRRTRPVSSLMAVSSVAGQRAPNHQDNTAESRMLVGGTVFRRRSREGGAVFTTTAGSAARPLCRQGAVRERPYSDTVQVQASGPRSDWDRDHLAPPTRPSYSRESSGGGSSDRSSSGVQGSGGRGGKREDDDVSPGGDHSSSQQPDISSYPPPSPRPSSLRQYPVLVASSPARPRVETEPARKEETSAASSSTSSFLAASAARRERREQRERERRRQEEEDKEKAQRGEGEGDERQRQWQKERWRNWQQLSADKLLDSEQETLV